MPTTYTVPDTHTILSHYPGRRYELHLRDGDSPLRPQDRILSAGVRHLSMPELIALVFNVGTADEDVMVMASRVIKEYGERPLTRETNPRLLSDALNIPLLKAIQLVACFEIGRRYFAKQAGRPVNVRHSKQAYDYLKTMGDLRKEELRGLYLDSRYQVIHDEVISIGTVTANIVHPREVFQPAIERGAVAVVIAHNHPSGELSPTMADTNVTDQLVSAGEILGIPLIDHLIITSGHYISLLNGE